jgi:small GTP-binding protein
MMMESKKFQYDVFISHSSKDKPTVRELAERLRKDGIRVWFDEWVIKPGDSIPSKIKQGLEGSRVLILVMSANAFGADWVTLERHTFLFRDPINTQRRFLPLRLDDAPIKDMLKQFSYIDWRKKSKEEYKKLLSACRIIEPEQKIETFPSKVLKGHKEAVTCVAITPDGRRAVSGSDDCTVRVWDLESMKCIAILEEHISYVQGIALTSDGKLAVSGSRDTTVRVWDLESMKCVSILKGHFDRVWGVALTPNGELAVSVSDDGTVRVWDLVSMECVHILKGHAGIVLGVSLTPDGKRAVSSSFDNTVRVWDLESMKCISILEGHTHAVDGVAITPDGKSAVSGSYDSTIRVWDLESMKCVSILEGHKSDVYGVAITQDGKRVISSSRDTTVRVWDLESMKCVSILEGHIDRVWGVVLTPDGRRAVSGSFDKTVRVWELPPIEEKPAEICESTRYTNAKVVLVGETGVGKTWLADKMCKGEVDNQEESTLGVNISQLNLPINKASDIEREVWLWDFAGQADYRLISQLYMDETALALLVFNPQDLNPFETLGYWEKSMRKSLKYQPVKLLVAGRIDRGGVMVSDRMFDDFRNKYGFAELLKTSAVTGEGCEELKSAIAKYIHWDRLPYVVTTKLFKMLKDAIIKLKDENIALIRIQELHQRLQFMLPGENVGFDETKAVVGLMQGQGMVQMLDFGDFVLLQPEQINRYASIVVRMAREHVDEMGVVSEQDVIDGRLDYKDMKRLSEADEQILLRAMVQTFIDRSLCIKEKTKDGLMLVFPSYFRRDNPDLPEHPNVFVTYSFEGGLEEIYSTLVVRLSYSDGFQKDQLWRDAADFKTPDDKRVGLAMERKGEGKAEIIVYFDKEVSIDAKVTFIKYVHEHLLGKAQNVTRVRTYVCPHCDNPVMDIEAIRDRLELGKRDIGCLRCDERIPLFDLIEDKFASDEFRQRVREMDETAEINLDNQSKELILVGQAITISAEANQIFRPLIWADWGIDGEIEFKNDKGEASGKRVYLQLKSGDSYTYTRKSDEKEIFTIKNPRHPEFWLNHPSPVMLVIRTSNGEIRWMNVTDYLKKRGRNVKQIVFEGEPFSTLSVIRLRDKLV